MLFILKKGKEGRKNYDMGTYSTLACLWGPLSPSPMCITTPPSLCLGLVDTHMLMSPLPFPCLLSFVFSPALATYPASASPTCLLDSVLPSHPRLICHHNPIVSIHDHTYPPLNLVFKLSL